VIVISDTNVLSSFAAAEALSLLQQLFAQAQIAVPPGVHQELQAGLERGKAHLDVVLQAIASGQILVLALSLEEMQQLAAFPARLNLGEREAIALTVTRRATLLSNDRRAINYCRQ
jgi:predicted nucleic acid-binding protein